MGPRAAPRPWAMSRCGRVSKAPREPWLHRVRCPLPFFGGLRPWPSPSLEDSTWQVRDEPEVWAWGPPSSLWGVRLEAGTPGPCASVLLPGRP